MGIMERLQAEQTDASPETVSPHYPARKYIQSTSDELTLTHTHTLVPCPVWTAADPDGAGQAEATWR